MTPLHSPRLMLISFAVILATATGCTSLHVPDLPSMPFVNPESDEYRPIDTSLPMQRSDPEQIYHSVRQARAENGIVLQVAEDEIPVRVLPLPPGQKSVFVSDLLKQTGVQEKLKTIQATLYRHSNDSIGGIPMEVKMSRDGRSIKPESDYALRAGDRLKVQKYNPTMKLLFSSILGL
jgi:hypothetical protein